MLNANWKQEGGGKKYRLKPYWGNPAVRNFRGSGGNLGIIEAQLAPLLYSTKAIVKNFEIPIPDALEKTKSVARNTR